MLDVTHTLDNRRALERSVETEQLARLDREIDTLLRKRDSIEQNCLNRDEEEDERRAARFARNDRREAKADVRYALTGERRVRLANCRPVFLVWHYIYERWRKAGYPCDGVEIELDRIRLHLEKRGPKATRADRVGFSERWVRELVRECVDREALRVQKHGQRPRTYHPQLSALCGSIEEIRYFKRLRSDRN